MQTTAVEGDIAIIGGVNGVHSATMTSRSLGVDNTAIVDVIVVG
jgi:hypothetical protein